MAVYSKTLEGLGEGGGVIEVSHGQKKTERSVNALSSCCYT